MFASWTRRLGLFPSQQTKKKVSRTKHSWLAPFLEGPRLGPRRRCFASVIPRAWSRLGSSSGTCGSHELRDGLTAAEGAAGRRADRLGRGWRPVWWRTKGKVGHWGSWSGWSGGRVLWRRCHQDMFLLKTLSWTTVEEAWQNHFFPK